MERQHGMASPNQRGAHRLGECDVPPGLSEDGGTQKVRCPQAGGMKCLPGPVVAAYEGYTHAAPVVRPVARLRALRIIPAANKTGNPLLLDSLLFHTPPFCTVQYVPWGIFFFS